MITLYLQLQRKHFRDILCGKKRIEYRDATEWYYRKFTRMRYTHIHFRNGYRERAPEMIVELRKILERDMFELHLGNVVSTKNLDLLE